MWMTSNVGENLMISKRGRGRPAMEIKKTNNQVRVYMTDEEYERVKRASERAGLSVSSWMRAVCLREAREEGVV